MARGWAGECRARCCSPTPAPGGPRELADEVGGEALAPTGAGRARRPGRARGEAGDAGRGRRGAAAAQAVLSLLGATSLRRVADAFPDAEVLRVMPNVGGRGAAGRALRRRRARSTRGPRDARAARARGRARRRVRRRDRGDGLRARLSGAGRRGDRRRRCRRTASTRSWPASWSSRRPAGTAELLRTRHPADVRRGGRLARRQHRGRARGARPGRARERLRGGRAGLAGEDARR